MNTVEPDTQEIPASLHLIFRPRDQNILKDLISEARQERRSNNMMAQILMEEAIAARRQRRERPAG